MPVPALLLVIATLLPLASFALLVFVGKRLGNPLAGYVGTGAIAGSFVCSMAAMFMWLGSTGGTYGPQNLKWGAGDEGGPISIALPWI